MLQSLWALRGFSAASVEGRGRGGLRDPTHFTLSSVIMACLWNRLQLNSSVV